MVIFFFAYIMEHPIPKHRFNIFPFYFHFHLCLNVLLMLVWLPLSLTPTHTWSTNKQTNEWTNVWTSEHIGWSFNQSENDRSRTVESESIHKLALSSPFHSNLFTPLQCNFLPMHLNVGSLPSTSMQMLIQDLSHFIFMMMAILYAYIKKGEVKWHT